MNRLHSSNWNASPVRLFLLGGLLALMLLILVLPDDVDLPDAAFHRGTAPVLVHSTGLSAPLLVAYATASSAPLLNFALHWNGGDTGLQIHPVSSALPIVYRNLRC